MAELKAQLGLAPEDAVRWFERKGDVLSWDWPDVWREANVHAFTVAKATSIDVLSAIRKQVSLAIGEGKTFADFKKALRPQLEDLGWWGQKEVLDGDTGELTKVQLGSARRLRTIYQTNVQTAYMAGRYTRLVGNAAVQPYWRYVAVMDGRTRPAHAALNGKVWRWDDPIWEVIWPPNGWGCRCRVVALTQAAFEQLGVPLESGADAIVEHQVPITRDGVKVSVKGVRYLDERGKEKVFWPDPGWDYNPGAEWARFDAGGQKSERVVKALDDIPTWSALGRPDLRNVDPTLRLPDPGELPAAPTRALAHRLMLDALLPGGQIMRTVATPIEQVIIRAELLPHITAKEQDARERFASYVVPTLEQPFEVWLTPYDDGTYRKRYIGLFQARNDLLVVVRENRDGSLLWEVYNVLQAASKRLNQLRFGTLLYVRPGS